MKVLPVLMWKHLIVKKRRFILTAVDILSPIFFFVILFIFRNEINPVRSHSISIDGMNIDNPNLTGDSWPRRLNYTIRMRRDFMTHTYKSFDGRKVPHAAFGEC
ncbi:hypothetical protein ACJJTC_010646 [Scirpophaga incertulas]